MILRGRRRSERGAPVELGAVVGELFATAQAEAVAFRHDCIGTEHMLLALLSRDDDAGRTLRELGLDIASVRADVRRLVGEGPDPESLFDADALAALGVDLAAVRARVEAIFGEGSLERARQRGGGCHGGAFGVSPRLKRALESARCAAARSGGELSSAHVAVGLSQQTETVAGRILEAHAISHGRLVAALGESVTPRR